jgi:hypothetical protein
LTIAIVREAAVIIRPGISDLNQAIFRIPRISVGAA